MQTTQPPSGNGQDSRATHVTLVGLGGTIAGLVAGIFAARVGDLTLYQASAVGGGSAFAVMTLGLAVLAYVRG